MKRLIILSLAILSLAILPGTASATTGTYGPCTLNVHTPTFSGYGTDAGFYVDTSCADAWPQQVEMCVQTNGGNGWIPNGCSLNPSGGGTTTALGLGIRSSWANFPCHVWVRLWGYGYVKWQNPPYVWTSSSKALYSNATYRVSGC